MPLIMHGNWTVSIKEKNAAFPQRFIVSGASSGNGTYVAPHSPVNVNGTIWSVRIQSDPGSSSWADSEYQITSPVVSAGQYSFDLQSNDVWAGDKDFNDLVLTFSTPVTETDFLVYGHVSSYTGCSHNPCYPGYIVIESAAALAKARLYPVLKESIDLLYPSIPITKIPLPDPPPDLPAALLSNEVFKPILIPVEGKTYIPVKKARIMQTFALEINTNSSKKKAALVPANKVEVESVEYAKPASETAVLNKVALSKLRDIAVKTCQVEPLVNAALRFLEYDRTDSELGGGLYTGEGDRETIGQASTDRNGNYIFRFKRTLSQLIDESNFDVALGEDETLEALPDLIVQVLGATLPGGNQYETAPYWNISTLKRINICIPGSYWHVPSTGCHGKPISHIGYIPVGKPSTVSLDADGRVTCTDTSKIDIPQTHSAAWWGALRMSACIGKYDQVPTYTLEYRARRPNGSWTNWVIYQEALMLDNWNSTLGDWVATKVGPFIHNVELVKGSAKQDVFAYNNVQGNMDWSGPDWFIKAIIPSWLYSYNGGPGSVEFRLKAYDSTGNLVALWTDPSTSMPKFNDIIRLYIDHTGPELDMKEITIGTPTPNPCPLFTLTGPELITATLNLKFKAVQRQGFLNNYVLSVTKCNTPNFSVEDLGSAHPLNVNYVPGSGLLCPTPACLVSFEPYGTVFGADTAAALDDYVSIQLNPTGSNPWLDPGETLSSFTLNLSAGVRRTDGRYYYPGYGPIQYNLVIQRGV
jgi:hypothetical protein